MGEKKIVSDGKLPRYLTTRQLRREIVDWSDEVLKSRIDSGFPAFKDDKGQYLFPTLEVLDYMKRREKNLRNG